MRLFIVKTTLICVFLLLPGRVSGSEAKAILERAIGAHGGADGLERTKRGRLRARCTGESMGKPFDFICEDTFDLPARYRHKEKGVRDGSDHEIESGCDGRKIWLRQGRNAAQYISGDKRQPLEYHWHAILAQLLQLRGKDNQLTFLGEETKDGRRLAGIHVVSPRAEADLYFDKSTGLLARTRRPRPTVTPGVFGENIYSDYRDIGGVRYPMHCRESVPDFYNLDIKITSLDFLDKIDDGVFVKPPSPSSQPSPSSPRRGAESSSAVEPPARWNIRLIAATLNMGLFVGVVWLIVRVAKKKQSATPPQ